jgi:hypothetical protein
MKNFLALLFCFCIFSSGNRVFAQTDKIPVNEPDYNKPRLFDALPSRIPVTIDELNSLINEPSGKAASFKFSGLPAKQIDGKIISVAGQGNKIQSTVLRSTNFNGATLTVSKIRNDDGSFSFTGRVISFQHGDLFELKKEEGNYVLVKRNFYELVNE